jgi:hypothetical protein
MPRFRVAEIQRSPRVRIAAANVTLDRIQAAQAERAKPIFRAREFLAQVIRACCPRACEVVPEMVGIETTADNSEFWYADVIATGFLAEPRALPPYPTVANGGLIMLIDELDAALQSGAVGCWLSEHPGAAYQEEFVVDVVEFLREQLQFK